MYMLIKKKKEVQVVLQRDMSETMFFSEFIYLNIKIIFFKKKGGASGAAA